MRIKFASRAILGLLASSALLAGCANNPSALNASGKLPADPAVDRSEVETLTKNKPVKSTVSVSPAANPMPTESELGVPIYPDAKPYNDSTGVVSPMATEGMKMAILETKDSLDKVVAFYKGEMPQATLTKDVEEGQPLVRLSEPAGKGGLKAVSVTTKEGKTQIIVTNVAEMPTVKSNSVPAPSGKPEAGNLPPH